MSANDPKRTQISALNESFFSSVREPAGEGEQEESAGAQAREVLDPVQPECLYAPTPTRNLLPPNSVRPLSELPIARQADIIGATELINKRSNSVRFDVPVLQ